MSLRKGQWQARSRGINCHGSLDPGLDPCELDPCSSVQTDEVLGQEEGKWSGKERGNSSPLLEKAQDFQMSWTPLMLHKKGQPGP